MRRHGLAADRDIRAYRACPNVGNLTRVAGETAEFRGAPWGSSKDGVWERRAVIGLGVGRESAHAFACPVTLYLPVFARGDGLDLVGGSLIKRPAASVDYKDELSARLTCARRPRRGRGRRFTTGAVGATLRDRARRGVARNATSHSPEGMAPRAARYRLTTIHDASSPQPRPEPDQGAGSGRSPRSTWP